MKAELILSAEARAREVMERCHISPKTGFLMENPPSRLIDDCSAYGPRRHKMNKEELYLITWDEIAYSLENLITLGNIASTAKALPLPPSQDIFAKLSREKQFRLMMIVEMFIHAYFKEILEYKNVHELMSDESVKHLPPQLAIPSWKLSDLTGVAPSCAYCLYSTGNYRLKDPNKPIDLDNIQMLHSFTGSLSETWFVNIHQVIDYQMAPTQLNLLTAHFLCERGYFVAPVEAVTGCITNSVTPYRNAITTFERMTENCDYKTYFDSVRLFYGFPKHVVFDGVEELRGEPQELLGETGGGDQSLQFAICATGVKHGDEYFPRLRKHMPREQGGVISWLADNPRIRPFVLNGRKTGNWNLVSAYNELVSCIVDFRKCHRRMVNKYIQEFGDTHGTGKPPLGWLDDLIKVTEEHYIR